MEWHENLFNNWLEAKKKYGFRFELDSTSFSKLSLPFRKRLNRRHQKIKTERQREVQIHYWIVDMK